MAHWKAVKRIMGYLKGTANYSLYYQGDSFCLIRFTDVDLADDLDGRKLIFGYIFLLNGGIISWASKKQICVTLSTIGAKFVTSAYAIQEVVWLGRFLQHLGIVMSANVPVKICCNN